MKKLNENKESPKELGWCISGSHFDEVVKGVKDLAAETKSPSLAITLVHYIKHIALLKGSLATYIHLDSKTMKTEKEKKPFLSCILCIGILRWLLLQTEECE